MEISVLGLGYVGKVSAGCLARHGHVVLGIDPAPAKIELVDRCHSPIIGYDIGDIVARAHREDRLALLPLARNQRTDRPLPANARPSP